LDIIADLRRRVAALEAADGAPLYLVLRDGVTAPTAVTGLALIYVDTSDGDLKVKFGDGTTKTIVADT
jgi:hypothetical protein